MSTAPVIHSFRNVLSQISDTEIKLSNEEIDDLIHYLFTRDKMNLLEYENDLREILLYLLDIVICENLTSVHALINYYDNESKQLYDSIKSEIKCTQELSNLYLSAPSPVGKTPHTLIILKETCPAKDGIHSVQSNHCDLNHQHSNTAVNNIGELV